MRRLTLIGSATLLAVSCGINKNADPGGDAPVVLRMTKVQASEMLTSTATWVDHLISDVQTCGSVFNDDAQLSFDAVPKNPDVALLSPGLNDLQLQTFTVHWIRTDGHQLQGVDVPYDFSGALSGTVPGQGGTTVNAVMILVRHTAKLEPPLAAMAGMSGEDLLETVAQITAYGRTTSGVAVQATGYIGVTFGNFGDPKTCPNAAASPTPTPSP